MSSKKKEIPPFKMIPVSMRERLHEFTGAELKLFICLYLHSGKDNTAFPSNKTIMRETGLSRPGLKEAKKGLRKKGFSIAAFQRRRDDGGLSSMTEKIIMPVPRDENHTQLEIENIPTQGQNSCLSTVQKSYLHEVNTSEADTGNADTGKPQEQLVNQSVSSVSLRSTSIAADAAPSLESKDEQNRFVIFEQDKPEPDPKDREIADMLGHTLHEEFGVPYITADQDDALLMIAHMSRTWCPQGAEEKTDRAKDCCAWAKGLARFSTQHKFWSQRTFTPDQLAKHMYEDTGKGICAQYNRAVLKRRDRALHA
jgi:hypothetical protein